MPIAPNDPSPLHVASSPDVVGRGAGVVMRLDCLAPPSSNKFECPLDHGPLDHDLITAFDGADHGEAAAVECSQRGGDQSSGDDLTTPPERNTTIWFDCSEEIIGSNNFWSITPVMLNVSQHTSMSAQKPLPVLSETRLHVRNRIIVAFRRRPTSASKQRNCRNYCSASSMCKTSAA